MLRRPSVSPLSVRPQFQRCTAQFLCPTWSKNLDCWFSHVKAQFSSEYVSDKENIDDIKKSVQFELDIKDNERPDKSKHRRHLGIQRSLSPWIRKHGGLVVESQVFEVSAH